MLLAGIDLAWKADHNPSAVAFGHLQGKSLELAEVVPDVRGTKNLFSLIKARNGLVGIAIDAPLIINNCSNPSLFLISFSSVVMAFFLSNW